MSVLEPENAVGSLFYSLAESLCVEILDPEVVLGLTLDAAAYQIGIISSCTITEVM